MPALLEAVESVYRAGADVQSTAEIDQLRWHDQAIELSKRIDPEQLSGVALKLLGQIPFTETAGLIRGIKQDAVSKEVLQGVTTIRKDCYTVRDTAMLVCAQNPRARLKSLYDTCHHLGTITDTQGKRGRDEALSAIEGLQDLSRRSLSLQPLHASEEFVSVVGERLKVSELLIRDSEDDPVPTDISYDDYHKFRKAFRRVAGTAVLAVAGLGLSEHYDMAVLGVALSSRHGQIKDELYAREQAALALSA